MGGSRPAWSRESGFLRAVSGGNDFSPDWAFVGSTGGGVRVAVVDSGIDADHPLLEGSVDEAAAVEFRVSADGQVVRVDGPHDDVYGHGTACAGIIHALAPDAEITSVRVVDESLRGKAAAFHAGLEWAVEAGYDIINLSLGAAKREWALAFHDVCDRGYFANSFIVTAANNVNRDSFPSLYASVTSVASNTSTDPLRFHFNPDPPTEFLARGIDVQVPWLDGTSITTTGNSFAAPHIAAFAALIKAKHPDLRPFQIKTALWAASANVRDADPTTAGRTARVTVGAARPTLRTGAGLGPRRSVIGVTGPGGVASVDEPGWAEAVRRERQEIQSLMEGYDVGDLVDRGPWGPVWAARHEGQAVAIRRLDPNLASDPTMRERFAASVRIAAGIRHPHVLPILDLREAEDFAVTVMPLCPTNLARWRLEQAAVEPAAAGAAALSLLNGLHEAHACGIFHGDLRPENALIDERNRVVVSDVGIAAALSSDARTSAAPNDPRTWAYLAPEQIDGTAIGAYTDVHAVGLTLCKLLTGELPWPRVESLGAMVRQRATEEPRPVADIDPSVPAALADLIDAATAIEPADRPTSARAFAQLLGQVLDHELGRGWLTTQPLVVRDDLGHDGVAVGR
ncbi:MAG: S8 family serine peptidase [Actinomycetota bacterium]